MEDCQHIDAKIGVRIVKTIFSVQPAQVSVTSTCRGTFLALFVPWQMLQHALGYVLGPFRGPGDAGEDTTTAFGSQSLWSLGIER